MRESAVRHVILPAPMSNESCKDYFSELNYTFGNEDTQLEYDLLHQRATHVACVAGSGSRVIPLLAKKPDLISCIDTSLPQLHLTRLRIESLRLMTRDEYCAFWGYGTNEMSFTERRGWFDSLNLPAEARTYLIGIFDAHAWESLLYAGRWEHTFRLLSNAIRLLVGPAIVDFFSCRDSNTHTSFMQEVFPKKRWDVVTALLGNSTVFNRLLYRGHFPRYNMSLPITVFYKQAFQRLFAQGPARENAFLQILILGKVVHDEGLPIECEQSMYVNARNALASTVVQYVHAEAPDAIATQHIPIDFVSFSDVPSYFSDTREQSFMQHIRGALTTNARVINRYYLHVPQGVQLEGFADITNHHRDIIANEKVQMYEIKVYHKI